MTDLPPWLKVLYPFRAHFHGTAEGRLHYVDEGKGPPVVMLHGNPTWSFFYRDLILALREKHRCLVPDHLGCGLSDKPQSYRPYTLEGHVRRTCEWIDRVDPGNFHLVVHDWGGAIGFGVARLVPERIRSISILNTAAFPFPSIPLRISACRIPGVGALLVRGANAFARGATRMASVEPLSEAVREGYLFPYDTWRNRVAVHAFVKDVPMRKGHRSRKTLEAIEESLGQWQKRPVQMIWGMRDWCFHREILGVWESILPMAEIHRLENAGHYLLDDAGEEVARLVGEFLQRMA
ncbi:MAG: alpha/beta fold hydrolase [Oceanipulchritudo sp.]